MQDGDYFGRIGYNPYILPAVQIYDPELAEKAMRNQGSVPSRGKVYSWNDYRKERKEKFALLIGDGEQWRKSRCRLSHSHVNIRAHTRVHTSMHTHARTRTHIHTLIYTSHLQIDRGKEDLASSSYSKL